MRRSMMDVLVDGVVAVISAFGLFFAFFFAVFEDMRKDSKDIFGVIVHGGVVGYCSRLVENGKSMVGVLKIIK